MRIKMTDDDGNIYHWSVKSFKMAWNCGGTLKKGRYISGWSFIDHDGVERCSEGNWNNLVEMFKRTATNYGFACNIS